jgi:hypothetical protein
MRSATTFLSALFCALVAGPVAAQDLVDETMPSGIRIELQEPGLLRILNTTRRYQTNLLAVVAEPGVVRHQLLEIEQRSEQVEGPEADTQFGAAEVTLRAYPLTDQGKGAQIFEIKVPGDAAEADGPYLTVTRYGCCAEQSTHAVFSLETGAYLFNATGTGRSGDWVTMGARGGFENERIIAAHVALATHDGEILGGYKNAVAAITYARRDKPLQRVLLVAPQAAIDSDAALNWLSQPSLVAEAHPAGTDHIFIEREGKGPELFTGIAYRMVLDETTTIEIPIVADRFDIKAATLPEGYSLVEQDLAGQPY